MGNFKRERHVKNTRFANQIELIELIDYGAQTNASLIAFTGANTVPQKLKSIVDKDSDIVREKRTIFNARGTYFYSLKNRPIDFIEAKVNNAIGHAAYVLRDAGLLMNTVRRYGVKDKAVMYRAQAVARDVPDKVVDFVFSFYNIEQDIGKYYNYNKDLVRVIVFEDIFSYRMFVRDADKSSIEGQLHVVLDENQSAVKQADFEVDVYVLQRNDDKLTHTKFLDGDSLVSYLKGRMIEFDREIIEALVGDYIKAKREAEKFLASIKK